MYMLKKLFFFNHRSSQNTAQIFDLLQLSRKEKECRAICIQTMRKFDGWKKSQSSQNDSIVNVYAQIEGMMLRRQAQDAVLVYRLIRKDRMRAFNKYIEKLPVRSKVKGAA